MRHLKILILPLFVSFLLSGCWLSIGQSEFGCGMTEELSSAGVCGNYEYILKNKENLDELSYRGLTRVNGRFIKNEK